MPGLHSHWGHLSRLSRNCEQDVVRMNVDIHTRHGTHECRHSHSRARTTRQVQLSKVTRQLRAKKKFSHYKDSR